MFLGYLLIGLVELCVFILAVWGFYCCIMLIKEGIKFFLSKIRKRN